MTGDGKTPGNGTTSPFATNGGPMPGNDFIKNPAGSSPGGRGVDFVRNPGGVGPTAATPPDFTKGGKDPQRSGSDPTNPASEVKDKGLLVPLADVAPGSPRGNLVGVGSMGDTRKPFKGI